MQYEIAFQVTNDDYFYIYTCFYNDENYARLYRTDRFGLVKNIRNTFINNIDEVKVTKFCNHNINKDIRDYIETLGYFSIGKISEEGFRIIRIK